VIRKPTKTPDELLDLWLEYQVERSVDVRNELVMHHLHLVTRHAKSIWQRLPRAIQLEDLVSAGAEGLIQAVESFDVGRGFQFATYAAARIRGAILDWLRDGDDVPRLVRQHAALVAEARAAIYQATGQDPSDEQLATAVALTPRQFADAIRTSKQLSLHEVLRPADEGDGAHRDRNRLFFRVDEGARRDAELRRMRERIFDLLRGLRQTDRLIVLLYYFEGNTMREIGEQLGLSESRVSQRHSQLILELHAKAQRRSDA
jgi:RNA polymerase sigma factor FliA